MCGLCWRPSACPGARGRGVRVRVLGPNHATLRNRSERLAAGGHPHAHGHSAAPGPPGSPPAHGRPTSRVMCRGGGRRGSGSACEAPTQHPGPVAVGRCNRATQWGGPALAENMSHFPQTWQAPMPCSDWSVYEIAKKSTGSILRTGPSLSGQGPTKSVHFCGT